MGSRPLLRRGARRDANEAGIVDALETLGAVVRWINSPGTGDLLVGYAGTWWPVEIKRPRDGRMTPAQEHFAMLCQASGLPRRVVRDRLEAHELLRDMARTRGDRRAERFGIPG